MIYGKLLRDFIPEDQVGKRKPWIYRAGSIIEITFLGVYVRKGNPNAGWLYKNMKTREVYKSLQLGVDFEEI